MSIPESIKIGTRIQVGKDRATVKFIGKVQDTKGEWLGIEWDDPKRGKHDGSHKNTKYFECRYPTSGSFIRYQPDKVLFGQTFMQAFKDKYTAEQEENSVNYDKASDKGELYWGGNKNLVVETYGFGKVQRSLRQLSNLTIVGLAEEMISSAGPNNDILDSQLMIEDLDLSMNLIADWETVIGIVSQLPQLKILRLNQLRLAAPMQSFDFHHIQTLALNRSMIPWKNIEVLASGLPKLENLQLAGNGIKSLSSIHWESIKCLYLEDNLIDDWTEVEKLQSLPNLQVLFLNNNKIKTIKKNCMLPKLEYLRIEENAINDWDSINSLNEYPNLSKLRCKNNPIFEVGLDKETEASQIVGRIRNLTVVNGNTMVQLMKSLLPFIQDTANFVIVKHGEPDLQAQVQKTSTVLNDRLISVTISLRDLNQIDLISIDKKEKLPFATKSISKRFLPTMSIRNIKHLIQKLLKIPATKQKLYLLQSIDNGRIMVMDISDDLRDLKYYGINQQDEILVCE
ncbi:hypothetical protein G6F62_001211 [Rhizopus arrhizus]|uniref:Tubulin-folding cofactor E n=1 Tax=Rhizopus oryzae TaxID=64495 RepID=A0A9P7BT26_RHIOR|nr:hypothetical protein G6F23_001853 [Rhizopus arrhizus]KAG0763863.1 hypothetical protein G6F24_005685 [Rhizopus arrhizus]KAG0790372.1 hypothetical protein G6F21_005858 [Rhizopus arrhizus]KAG0799256.1 hypothetical protein G6F22_003408 [Rhizopus arrhizus]KAG0811900.1 hypothetical protein G6F20_006794 [Rhizopus arrhizus]